MSKDSICVYYSMYTREGSAFSFSQPLRSAQVAPPLIHKESPTNSFYISAVHVTSRPQLNSTLTLTKKREIWILKTHLLTTMTHASFSVIWFLTFYGDQKFGSQILWSSGAILYLKCQNKIIKLRVRLNSAELTTTCDPYLSPAQGTASAFKRRKSAQ